MLGSAGGLIFMICRFNRFLFISDMMSIATRVRPSISETTEKIMPAPVIDYSAPPRAAELPAAPPTAPARPASEGAGQRSRAIIPGDDPGDQQPPKSIRAAAMLRLMDKPQDTPTLPARYYRQKAVQARQSAEEATTRAIKERLHGSARDFDKLADAADRAGETVDPPARVTSRR
jgi:hypothetical protein